MEAPASPPAIALHDVSKRYGRHWALARLTYSLPPGRSLLLTGHNGSGKTTLLRLVATALSPTAGRVEVLGRNTLTDRDAVRQEVALLSHASFLYEDLTGAPEPHGARPAAGDALCLGHGQRAAHAGGPHASGRRARCASSAPACASAWPSRGC